MTQPSYTTDLQTVDLAESLTSWAEIPSRKAGGAQTLEDRAYIQGSYSISQSTGGATGKTAGLECDYGSNISGWTSGWAIFMWQYWQAPGAVDTWANGGMRIGIGSATTAINLFNAQGNDTRRNPYGGWDNIAIDPEFTPVDEAVGSPTAGSYRYFWSAPNILSAVSKGNPHCVDAIRYGRGELIIEYGDATNGYCTFGELGNYNDANDISFIANTTNTDATLTNISATEVDKLYPGAPLSGTGIPASTYVQSIVSSTSIEMTNNATATNTGVSITSIPANRLGLFKKEGVSYLWKGLISIGTSTNAVDFRDTNKNITVDDTPRTYAAFNRIEINNASSNVEWTGINITALNPSGLSIGQFEMIHNAILSWTTCVFTDMSTWVFLSNATLNKITWRRCALVIQGGGDFDNCIFDEATGAVALLVDNPDNVDNCTFNSDGTGHAIELTTACAGNSYTLTNFWVNGYAASDGSTGNEVIFNDSGGAVTINIDGGSGVSNISVMNGSGASTNLVANYSFTITGLELNTEVTIVTAGTSIVLHHTENATTSDGEGKYQATYSHSGGASVDVLIHHVDYLPDISNIYGLTLPSTNSSAKASMFEDLNYENPT